MIPCPRCRDSMVSVDYDFELLGDHNFWELYEGDTYFGELTVNISCPSCGTTMSTRNMIHGVAGKREE